MLKSVQCGDSSSSKIELKKSSEQCSIGERLYVIELRRYNEIGDYYKKWKPQGTGTISYRHGLGGTVTRRQRHMGVKETDGKGHRGAIQLAL